MIQTVRRLLHRSGATLRGLAADLSARYRRRVGGSDVHRWRKVGNLSPLWDVRTRRMAQMVPPRSAVLEFGAGRRVLEAMLNQPARYTPSDLVDRGPGTVVCDLNARPLPAFDRHDVAVFSGVLEYVNDVPSLIQHLNRSVPTILASYAVLEKNGEGRRSSGWVNDYTAAQFVAVFAQAGFDCVETVPWESQVIYRFVAKGAGARQ